MQLHQLLRYIPKNNPIILFDIEGIEIVKVLKKADISIDLYEYEIFDIKSGTYNGYIGSGPCLCITLRK